MIFQGFPSLLKKLTVTRNLEIFQGFYFRETPQVRSFLKINSSQNVEIILSFTDVGKSALMFLFCKYVFKGLFAKI